MSIRVSEIEYDSLIKEVPSLTSYNICFIADWTEVYHSLDYFAIRNEKTKEICGAFCLYRTKRKGYIQAANPPYFQNNGLWIEEKHTSRYDRNSYAKRVLSTFSSFLNTYKWVNISLPIEITDTQPFFWDEFSCLPRYTYLLELSQDDLLKENMSKGLRRDINRISEVGISYLPALTERAIDILYDSTASHRGEEEASLWKKLFSKMKQMSSFYSGVADLSGQLGVASSVQVGETAIYLFGGSDKVEGAPLGTAALWQIIKESREKGIKTIDFEGSMIQGIERYFRSFGAELTVYYNIQKEPKLIRTAKALKA